ncbi:diaminopimelate dehydrogenase [Clostridiales bacterium COT073_COT-073]|nr:diaminopimelate dehydrogenase [Clostridiales bacterium COT073_COT-073]
MEKIKIGIVGYGNLGKSAEVAIRQNEDMELVGVFTRRNPTDIKPTGNQIKVYPIADALSMQDKIDVMLLCGGSKSDIPVQGPYFIRYFNTVDGYDTHARIPEYYEQMNEIAIKNGKLALIAGGWDPGMFSIQRILAEAVLPEGKTYTFWGKGVSQGHSDAIRRINGVRDAKQYTIPLETAVNRIKSGEMPELTTREKHLRECFVVAEDGADLAEIERQIKTMPDYFADYDTVVHFISQAELEQNHAGLPHGGRVIRIGKTGGEAQNLQQMEYSLNLDSNPDFTASVLLAYVRAVYRLNQEGQAGAKTVADIAPAYLLPKSADEIRRDYI